jgi:hypothetical protein
MTLGSSIRNRRAIVPSGGEARAKLVVLDQRDHEPSAANREEAEQHHGDHYGNDAMDAAVPTAGGVVAFFRRRWREHEPILKRSEAASERRTSFGVEAPSPRRAKRTAER